ncbi:hypothetical protein P7K49_036838 [Saguinus oedipus]|uniref:Basic proline-rich protein-like n=1 Tax=Saguinus oedipus TaxID=9490 RepID=A0ABQ9TM89_SAGOE|nr:hypothetical protein P7K49_036838 [Saguinus oedipus]
MCERAARLCRAGAHRLLREPPPQGRALGGLLRWVGARMGEPRAPLAPADPADPGPGPASPRGGTAVILDGPARPPYRDRRPPAPPRPSASQSGSSQPRHVRAGLQPSPLPGPRDPLLRSYTRAPRGPLPAHSGDPCAPGPGHRPPSFVPANPPPFTLRDTSLLPSPAPSSSPSRILSGGILSSEAPNNPCLSSP